MMVIVVENAPPRLRGRLSLWLAEVRAGEQTLWRRVHTDSSYLSASDVRVHFGLGEKPDVRAVLVNWPDGSKESWDNVQPDKVVVLRQGSGKKR